MSGCLGLLHAHHQPTLPIELVSLPCTMQGQEMTLMNVVKCPHERVQSWPYYLLFLLPTETCSATSTPAPSPVEEAAALPTPSPASFGDLLSKAVSFELTGMSCHVFAVLLALF